MVNYTQINETAHLITADDKSHSSFYELTFSAGGSFYDEPSKEGEGHMM